MLFKKRDEKELKMIWEVQKNDKKSFLVGTAHFFPYSFKTTLRLYLNKARVVLFEGPLDKENMAKVVKAGFASEDASHLFNELDQHTISQITRVLAPARRDANSFFIMDLCKFKLENPIYDMIKGMKYWLAFFTIWHQYLQTNGWKYSVDLEGYGIAKKLGKKIVFLETIEEQIKVLESLSHASILEFLRHVDGWSALTYEYVQNYLEGDLEKLKSMRLRFPSRHHSVINYRDKIFYERMQPYLNEGGVVACVGAPHVRGLSKLFAKDGYQIKGPGILSQLR